MNTIIYLKTFCANIRTLRLNHHLTIQEMAALLELSDEQLALLESGVLTDEITIDVLYHIHNQFGITPNQIFHPDFLP